VRADDVRLWEIKLRDDDERVALHGGRLPPRLIRQ
jgi:hypothetical protein